MLEFISGRVWIQASRAHSRITFARTSLGSRDAVEGKRCPRFAVFHHHVAGHRIREKRQTPGFCASAMVVLGC
jgi:hypothetical protein